MWVQGPREGSGVQDDPGKKELEISGSGRV